ncbi:efflux RND transporter periplasmic adaptor subunit [Crenalkalicoccus roseus]|uniref:efflux RND transporter periplasmic adaptor subunit n=1 Tax=Crenalkalicoccus roseus TaxID=1485588 RepID=UPI0010809F11|nr:efflux RND transporter periplasmic adaptor subunit [Crenalkalicoccus roseus]
MGRINTRLLVFLGILLAATLWIGSGVLSRPPPAPPVPHERRPMTVAASWSEAVPVERILTLYGDVVPNQVVVVRAQTAGQIEAVATRLGAEVAPGEVLAQIALGDREARLRQAEARVATAERDWRAARQLAEQGVGTRAREEATLAEFEAARSQLASIRHEIDNTTVRAPILGVVNRLLAEAGDYVGVGGEVAEIVDNHPLRAVVQVPQHAIGRVRAGGPARVSLIGREPVPGTVRFVAPLADAATRTFRVEVEVPNPDRTLPSGVSAEVVIPTETVPAHRLSPALVSLDARGVPGVHAVDEEGIVVFHPLQLVRAEADAIWVAGMPERMRVITARQGFVTPGQRVEVRETPPGYFVPAGEPSR